MGDIVKITTGYFANEAFTVAKQNNIKKYTGIGKIVKTPSKNDHILTTDETGESEMIDNYNVMLEVSPYNYNWNNTVSYLEESDLEKV